MSERRRRTVRVSGDSEEFSEGSEDVEAIKASGGESEHDATTTTSGTRAESEYESAGSEDDRELTEKHRGEHDASSDINEEDGELLDDEEEDEFLFDAREAGDGQESTPNKDKKLDDDEDRRNPQYIPKRGTFYEHDDRTAEDQEQEEEKEEPRKKKVWKENDDCWSHDKFNESDQAPKSRDELVASYGYDIRSEEGPPRARRRRRYGRGPNKYDRNWEDENAYSKPTRGGGRGGSRKSIEGIDKESKSSVPDELEVQDEEQFPALSSPSVRKGSSRGRGGRGRPSREFESSQRQQARNQKQAEPPRPATPPAHHSNNSVPPAPTNQPTRSGRGKPARTGGSGRFLEGRGRGRGSSNHASDRKSYIRDDRDDVRLENDLKNLSIKEVDQVQSRDFRRQPSNKNSSPSSSNYHQPTDRRQTNVPPRLQQDSASNRPKRYSSQRQRSLQETSGNNYEQPGSYYEQQGYQQHAVYAETAQQAAPPAPQVVPVTSAQATPTPILQPPGAAFAPNYPSPPPAAYIPHVQTTPQPPRLYPSTQPAPAFITPSAPLINYVATPPAQFAPTYPAFQSFPPVPQPPPPQPTEMFVPSSGITYYSPQNQVPRHTPLKRPKAAIPILPPPAKEKNKNKQQPPPETETNNKKDVIIEASEQVIEPEVVSIDNKSIDNNKELEVATKESVISCNNEEKTEDKSSLDVTLNNAEAENTSIESDKLNVEDNKTGETPPDPLPTEVPA